MDVGTAPVVRRMDRSNLESTKAHYWVGSRSHVRYRERRRK